jgi:hypothetical protein
MKHGEKHVYTQLVNKEESYKHCTLEKDLAKAAKATKIHKKVAITQDKIRYKKGKNARNKMYYLHNFMPKKFIPTNPHKTSLAFLIKYCQFPVWLIHENKFHDVIIYTSSFLMLQVLY